MNLQRYTASSATQGMALAEVNWTKTGETAGPALLSRFFFVSVTLDGTSKITACSAIGGLAGEIWKRSPDDGNNIYYSEGNVGVGITNAVSKLEVDGGVKLANDVDPCVAAKEGTMRYNPTTKGMEYCNGTAWVGFGGGGGITSCPAGYSMVGDSGRRATFCINTAQRAANSFFNAVAVCNNINDAELGRAYLCTGLDWQTACLRGTGISGMGTGWEILSDAFDYGGNWTLVMGASGCSSMSRVDTGSSYPYRCCFR